MLRDNHHFSSNQAYVGGHENRRHYWATLNEIGRSEPKDIFSLEVPDSVLCPDT